MQQYYELFSHCVHIYLAGLTEANSPVLRSLLTISHLHCLPRIYTFPDETLTDTGRRHRQGPNTQVGPVAARSRTRRYKHRPSILHTRYAVSRHGTDCGLIVSLDTF